MTHYMIDNLRALDKMLVGNGHHSLSPFWWESIEHAYNSNTHQHVFRVGRQGGKTKCLERIAVLEAIYGEHNVKAGSVGTVLIVSADMGQAREFIVNCGMILQDLGIKPDRESVEYLGFRNLRGERRAIRARAASIRGVVSMTAVCVILDEVARWQDDERGGKLADDVLRSVRATMITQRKTAHLWMISSPMGETDIHAIEFAKGDDGKQTTHFAPTWVANPSITEAEARDFARDDREFKREYAAIPMGDVEHGFYPYDDLVKASDPAREAAPETITPAHHYVIACDPGFLHDCFAVAVSHPEMRDDGPHVVLDGYVELRGANGYTSPEYAISYVCALRKQLPGGFAVLGDQASAAVLAEAFARKGVMYVVQPWSPLSLMEKHGTTRALLADSRLHLPKFGALQKQMAKLGVKLTASQQETIASADGHIGDAASACVLAIAEAHAHLPMTIDQVKSTFNTTMPRLDGVQAQGSVFGDANERANDLKSP